MSIVWKYLDKRSAAVDALKDYGSMKFIIDHSGGDRKHSGCPGHWNRQHSSNGCHFLLPLQ